MATKTERIYKNIYITSAYGVVVSRELVREYTPTRQARALRAMERMEERGETREIALRALGLSDRK